MRSIHDVKREVKDSEGNYLTIYPLDEIIKMLEYKYDNMADIIDNYHRKYEELKNEKWKDEELQRMKTQVAAMKADFYRGFPISLSQSNRIGKWMKKHEESKHPKVGGEPRGGAIGGSYTYKFTPTSIGVFGSIECTCGEKFTFQEPD